MGQPADRFTSLQPLLPAARLECGITNQVLRISRLAIVPLGIALNRVFFRTLS